MILSIIGIVALLVAVIVVTGFVFKRLRQRLVLHSVPEEFRRKLGTLEQLGRETSDHDVRLALQRLASAARKACSSQEFTDTANFRQYAKSLQDIIDEADSYNRVTDKVRREEELNVTDIPRRPSDVAMRAEVVTGRFVYRGMRYLKKSGSSEIDDLPPASWM